MSVIRAKIVGMLAVSFVFGGLWSVSGLSSADDKRPQHSAVKPEQKDLKRHEQFLTIAQKGDIDVLFLGDSITDAWRGKEAAETWRKCFEPLKAANFGIGGDQTQHVLWRLQHGELEGFHPKVAVLMIGTNNMGSNSAAEIADGITAIVDEIHQRQPHTKVLLLGIFPRSERATEPVREKIKDVNQKIAKLDDRGKKVKYLDIGQKFLNEDGSISKEIMPDYLHLSAAGYKIWGEAIEPTVKELMQE